MPDADEKMSRNVAGAAKWLRQARQKGVRKGHTRLGCIRLGCIPAWGTSACGNPDAARPAMARPAGRIRQRHIGLGRIQQGRAR